MQECAARKFHTVLSHKWCLEGYIISAEGATAAWGPNATFRRHALMLALGRHPDDLCSLKVFLSKQRHDSTKAGWSAAGVIDEMSRISALSCGRVADRITLLFSAAATSTHGRLHGRSNYANLQPETCNHSLRRNGRRVDHHADGIPARCAIQDDGQ